MNISATPSPMPTPDLGGLLRRPVVPPLPTPPTPESEPTSSRQESAREDEQRAQEQPRPPRTQRPSAGPLRDPAQADRPSGQTGRQYLRSIAVYLPRSVHERLRTAASRQETTATALILAAVNDTHGRLAAALNSETDKDGPGSQDLFDIPQARKVMEPTVQTTIRVTDSQFRALTDLAAAHAANRSQVLTAALQMYLS